MLAFAWNTLLYYPLINLLIFFYNILFKNIGLSIIVLTLFIRFLLYPITKSQMNTMKKQRELSPSLSKLRKKYGNDKKKLAEAQMELYKKHNINPAAGCLPQIVQLILLIALYRAFIEVIGGNSESITRLNSFLYHDSLVFPEGSGINNRFFYLDLSKPDPYLVLPILAGISQFITSKISIPKVRESEKIAKKTIEPKDDVMYNMQEQMLYIFPLMTVFIGWKLPSGLVLYWLVTTVFSLAQQMIVNRNRET